MVTASHILYCKNKKIGIFIKLLDGKSKFYNIQILNKLMKNKEFFYLQYNKLKWENQEKTKINSFVNKFIIQNIIRKKKDQNIKIFDIGFGIGFFFNMLSKSLKSHYKNIILEGCEPSSKNCIHFKLKSSKNIKIKTYEDTFLNSKPDKKFDFITSIYVFPHFTLEDLKKSVKKIYSMLDKKGKFILVVANEKYLKNKLKTKKDLFIEKNTIKLNNKDYEEILHYSEIPEIGTLIDYNREEQYYLDLFKLNKFKLIKKCNLDDNGFLCTLFVFEKV